MLLGDKMVPEQRGVIRDQRGWQIFFSLVEASTHNRQA